MLPSGQASFFAGGPFVELENRLHRWRPSWSHAYTALAFVLFTWAIPEMLATTLGGVPQARAFFLDAATQMRLLVVGPIAILVEPLVGSVLSRAARNFVQAGIVAGEQVGPFELIVQQVKRLRDSIAPEIVIIGVAYLFALLSQSSHGVAPDMRDGWSGHSSPAWFWYVWVSRPFLHFLLVRWLWRIVIWTIFLFRISRLSLQLSAANPDRAGGLGFVAQAQASFGLVAFPFAVLWAAGWGESFVHGGTTAGALKSMLAVFFALVVLVFAGPLAVFTPKLVVLRQHALIHYGRLSDEYCRLFEQRWISAEPGPTDESLLGSADIQSLADLQNTVSAVRALRPIPLDRTLVTSLLAATLVPVIPLLTLILPLTEIVKRVLGAFL
jgi:hypothetical protein